MWVIPVVQATIFTHNPRAPGGYRRTCVIPVAQGTIFTHHVRAPGGYQRTWVIGRGPGHDLHPPRESARRLPADVGDWTWVIPVVQAMIFTHNPRAPGPTGGRG